jgi:hypothetical protein
MFATITIANPIKNEDMTTAKQIKNVICVGAPNASNLSM